MENTNNNEGKVFEQDLEQKSASTGAVFIIHLLMEEPCSMPDKDLVLSAMNKHLGATLMMIRARVLLPRDTAFIMRKIIRTCLLFSCSRQQQRSLSR